MYSEKTHKTFIDYHLINEIRARKNHLWIFTRQKKGYMLTTSNRTTTTKNHGAINLNKIKRIFGDCQINRKYTTRNIHRTYFHWILFFVLTAYIAQMFASASMLVSVRYFWHKSNREKRSYSNEFSLREQSSRIVWLEYGWKGR